MTTGYSFNPFIGNLDLITLTLSPSEITGGTPNSVAGFDSLGALESIPSWGIDTITGGSTLNLSNVPVDANANYIISDVSTTLAPAAPLTQLQIINNRYVLSLQGGQDFNTAQGLTISVGKSDVGTVNSVEAFNANLNLGDGTNATTINSAAVQSISANLAGNATITNQLTLSNLGANIQSGSTVNGVNGQIIQVTVDGTSTQNLNLLSLGINTNSAQTGVGIGGLQLTANVYDDLQYFAGFYNTSQFQSGANVANTVIPFSDNHNVNSGATILGGITSFLANPNFFSGSDVRGYTGLNISPTVASPMASNNVTIIQAGGNYSDVIQSITMANLGANVNSGTDTSNINGYTHSLNMQSGSTATNVNGYSGNEIIASGATVNNFRGFAVNPTINAAITGNITLAQLNLQGSGSAPQITGLNVDLNAFTASSGRNNGINLNGGTFNAFIQTHTASSLGVDSLNGMIPAYEILSGTPITGTTVLGQNFANLITVNDDFASGFLGTSAAAVGFVATADIATGKTMGGLSLALGGAQISGNGTLTDVNNFHAIGTIPNTGTPTITNLYGFRFTPLFSGMAVNTWGLSVEDALAENFMQKSLAIDTSSKKVTNASVGLEIGGTTKAARLSVLTTTERDALTALSGMTIFNDTTNALEFYDGSTWVTSSAGSGTVTSVDATVPSFLTVSGVPITTSGTIAIDLATQSANTVFAGPATGVDAQPTFRALVSADIPNNAANTTGTASNITASSNSTLTTLSALSLPGAQVTGNISGNAANVTGVVAIANGGTGQTTANAGFNALSPMTTGGDLIYGGASGVATRLANGSAGQVLTSAGTTAAPTWQTPTTGTVTSVAMTVPTFLSVSGSPITSSGTFAVTLSGTALPIANGGTGATSKAAAFDALSPMTTGGDIIYGGASGTGTRLANGSSGQFLKSNGSTNAPSWATPTVTFTAPTVQTFTSGTAATYTTPANVLYLKVTMVGGGGGGAGSSTQAAGNATGGTGGTATTFGTSLLVANGGSGAGFNTGTNNAGGTASLGTGPVGIALSGAYSTPYEYIGNVGTDYPPGGNGASTPLGGSGAGGITGAAGITASANTGSGGGGASGPSAAGNGSISGGGGAAGGYVHAIITSPAATYTYTVGPGGSGGSAGTSGAAGGSGAAGVIIVEEYYQ